MDSMEIPEGFFVHSVNFDAGKPYCEIIPKDNVFAEPTVVLIPDELAYYVTTHWCGSQKMHDLIVGDTKRKVSNQIREALLFNFD